MYVDKKPWRCSTCREEIAGVLCRSDELGIQCRECFLHTLLEPAFARYPEMGDPAEVLERRVMSCMGCNRDIVNWHDATRKGYCSLSCAEDVWKARSQLNAQIARMVSKGEIDCQQCGVTFHPMRTDQKYCSTKCRVKAHRAKKGEQRDER